MNLVQIKRLNPTILLCSIILAFTAIDIAYTKNQPTEVVKGVSEIKVKSDLASWQISLSSSGDDINSLYSQMDNTQIKLLSYLKNNNLRESDINLGAVSISNMPDSKQKYTIYNSVLITSKNVDLVQNLSSNLKPMLEMGIPMGSSYVSFYYTDISNIKGEMLKNSLDNSKIAASKMADNFGKKISGVKNINQGVISINSPDGSQSGDSTSLYKTVRMVSTVTYFIK